MPSYCQNGLHYVFDQLFQPFEAKGYFLRLEKEVEYLKGHFTKIKIYGKSFPIPRQHVAFGDDNLHYTFSGLTIPAKSWTPLLLEIKSVVESECGESFNFLLINRYRSGMDSINFHSDDETDLMPSSCIASVSFGQERKFVFKRTGFDSISLSLKSGSLLQMLPPTNELWYHGLPKQRESSGVRLNLTFRKMKSPALSVQDKPAGSRHSVCHSSAAVSPHQSSSACLPPSKKSCLHAKKILPQSVKSPSSAYFLQPTIMSSKRSASPSASTTKKMCVQEVIEIEYGTPTCSPSSSDISIENLPPHHYSLGGDKIALVSSFRGKVKVHIRKFRAEGKKIFPTKEGIVMSAHTFRLFMDEPMPFASKVYVLNKELLIDIKPGRMENATYSFQQLTRGYEQFLKFKSGEICLSMKQYEKLCDSVEDIWFSINKIQFGSLFRELVMQQITPSTDLPPSGTVTEDLTFILSDIVMSAIEKHIEDVYFCKQCHLPGQLFPNQHDCHSISREDKWRRYFDECVSLLDMPRLANAFVYQSGELSAFISEDFITSLNIPNLLETSKAMY